MLRGFFFFLNKKFNITFHSAQFRVYVFVIEIYAFFLGKKKKVGPLRCISVHLLYSGPCRSKLVQLCYFSLFGPLRFIRSNLVHFGLNWSNCVT